MKERELWPGWETVRKIGSGSFSTVYEIRRALPNGDIERAALKVITIPQNESDIDELYSSGYDDASITAHFRNYLADIVDEYALMSKIKGHTNVVYCDDVRYIQHIDGFGWDIFIKMELLTPLAKMKDIDSVEDFAIRLGCDICSALALCRKKNIIHRDIKPQNIFVSEDGNFKLGDFGIAKAVEKTTGGTKIGTYGYMAPEVYNNQPYGVAADIYSLGLVMYWLLNERRLPFLPLPPVIPKITDSEEARHRRFAGEPLPAPKNGSQELKRIVLKACAYDPANRYHTAEEMLADLTALCKASATPKQAIPLPEELPAEAEMDATMIDTDYPQAEEAPQGDKQPQKVPGKRRKPRKKRKSPVLAVAISLLAAIALLYIGWTNCWFGHDTQVPAEKTQNVLKNTPPDTRSPTDMYLSHFLGQIEYTRDQVTSIVFSDTQAPDTAWDVSESGNRDILAWMDSGTLHISSPQKISLPSDCTYMFTGFNNAKSIQFNDWVDTSYVTDMYFMFAYCTALQQLDLSGFDTSNVRNMGGMFNECLSLRELNLSSFNTGSVTSMWATFMGCEFLQQLDVSSFDTSRVTDMAGMFTRCESLEQLDISNFNTSNVLYMHYMFLSCKSLEKLDVSNFDTSSVTDMSYMFVDCPMLEMPDVSRWNFSKVISYENFMDEGKTVDGKPWIALFKPQETVSTQATTEKTQNIMKNTPPDTQSLSDMYKTCFLGQTEYTRGQVTSIVFSDAQAPDTAWDVSESGNRNILAWMDQGTLHISSLQKILLPSDCSYLFAGFNNAESIQFNDWVDTSCVTNMYFMFANCTSLQQLNLSGFDTSNVRDMYGTFSGCSSVQKLDLSSFNTASVTDMFAMFMDCKSLQKLDLSGFNTSEVTKISQMFCGCESLQQLDLSNFDTSKVSSMHAMFHGCESLQKLDLSGFDTSNVTNMGSMFLGCESLRQLDLSGFDTSNVTSMRWMFSLCSSLQQLDVPNFDTSSVTDMSCMFVDCPMLEMPDVSRWNLSKVTSWENFMDEEKTVDGKPWTALFISQSRPLERTGATFEELSADLAAAPGLKTLTVHAPSATGDELLQLREEYPNVEIHWDLEVFGQTFPDDATEVDISGQPISSIDEAKQIAAYFPNLTKLIVNSEGIDNEDMAAYREEVRSDYKVVWTIYFSDKCKARTDDTYFMPIKQGEYYFLDSYTHDLRYCEDMVCIDLGHNPIENIDFVAYMPHLKYLVLAWTKVEQITAISNCKELIYLEIGHDIIHDYTPLLGCTALEDLNISDPHYYVDITPVTQMTWLKNLWAQERSSNDTAALKEALPDTNVVISSTPDGQGWRNLQNYYDMRDCLGMPYTE